MDIIVKGRTRLGVNTVRFPTPGGGKAAFLDTSDADATAEDIAEGKTAYVNGSKITGTSGAATVPFVHGEFHTGSAAGVQTVEIPYEGASAMMLVDVEDRDRVADLVISMLPELPELKKRRK